MTTGPLTGTTALAKLALRRDRIMLPVWIYVVVIGVAANAYAFAKLYKTRVLAGGARRVGGEQPGAAVPLRPAERDLGRRAHRLAVRRLGRAVRRADERLHRDQAHQGGRGGRAARADRLGAGRDGRRRWCRRSGSRPSPTWCSPSCCASCSPLLGLPAAGSVALSLAIGTCGLAFTGISAVAAQLTSGARSARGLAFGVLGVAFLARAVGDAAGAGGPAWLTWVLPLGWTEMLRPFAGERWWVLALPLALFAAGGGLAFALAASATTGRACSPTGPAVPSRRHCCAARSRSRCGSSGARWPAGRRDSRSSSRSAARRARASASWWAQAGRCRRSSPGSAGSPRSSTRTCPLSCSSPGSSPRPTGCPPCSGRAEETAGRADPVLAGSVGRVRWGLSHLIVAVAGTALLLAIAGLATGLGYGLSVGGTGGGRARMLGAGLAELPAALVIVGVAIAGARPAAAGACRGRLDGGGPRRRAEHLRAGAPAIPLGARCLPLHARAQAARRCRRRGRARPGCASPESGCARSGSRPCSGATSSTGMRLMTGG